MMRPNPRVLGCFAAGLLALHGAFATRAAHAEAAADKKPASPTVESVDVVDTSKATTVSIQLSARIEGAAVSSFYLSSPERLVVDIADATIGEEPPEVVGEGRGLVSRVEAAPITDATGQILRVTLYLTGPAQHDLNATGDAVNLSIKGNSRTDAPDALATALGGTPIGEAQGGRPLSGPALPMNAPPTVATLDVESLDNISRIVIGTNGPLAFAPTQPESNLIVVDLPGAALAPSLERPLDMSSFVSPVRMIRAYKTRTGSRIAINMRREAPFEVRRISDHLIYVDIEIPPDMLAEKEMGRQSYSGAAPSTPSSSGGEGLKSAYQQEVLIGASGRTIDPQAAFGQGMGSMDPSSMMGLAAGFMIDQGSSTDIPYSGQRINVDLVNADIHSVFRLVSQVSKLNIVAGDDVSGRVTVRLENVPWDQAFAAILQAKGLGSQRFGNIVRIAPIDTIKQEQQSALETKKATIELEDLQLYVVPLNYAQASDLSDQVTSALSARGTMQVDSRSNQLIIRDAEENLAQVRELVRQLDKQTPQVLIEARIVEAASTYTRGLGIQWGGSMDASTATGYSTGLLFPSSIGISGGNTAEMTPMATFFTSSEPSLAVDLGSPLGAVNSLALHLGSIPGLLDLDARLSAMESEGWGKVVSAPRIVTLDNEEASVSQGAQIPYLSVSSAGTTVKFITAALTLTATPHITSDDKVFLELDIANNRADFSSTVQGQPAILIKEAKTSLLVASGETMVIGGVYATETSVSHDRVPFLGHIPVIGWLFSNSGSRTTRTELLVFITPRILSEAVAQQQ